MEEIIFKLVRSSVFTTVYGSYNYNSPDLVYGFSSGTKPSGHNNVGIGNIGIGDGNISISIASGNNSIASSGNSFSYIYSSSTIANSYSNISASNYNSIDSIVHGNPIYINKDENISSIFKEMYFNFPYKFEYMPKEKVHNNTTLAKLLNYIFMHDTGMYLALMKLNQGVEKDLIEILKWLKVEPEVIVSALAKMANSNKSVYLSFFSPAEVISFFDPIIVENANNKYKQSGTYEVEHLCIQVLSIFLSDKVYEIGINNNSKEPFPYSPLISKETNTEVGSALILSPFTANRGIPFSNLQPALRNIFLNSV